MPSSFNAYDSVVVKDDFYENPDEVRQLALGKTYEKPQAGTVQLAANYICTDEEAIPLIKRIKPYVKSDPENPVQGASILFRYTLAGVDKKVFCHVDGCSYAGILYLTLPEHCAGGTTIYRHKPTGDEIYDKTHRHLYDFNDPDQWEVLREMEMVYNRMVMYPGQLFHAITPVFFGDTIENGRLTQNLFLFRKNDGNLL